MADNSYEINWIRNRLKKKKNLGCLSEGETKATNFIALCIPLSYGFQPFSFNNDVFLRNSDHPPTPSNIFCYFHLPVIVHHSSCISSSLFSTY